MIGPGADRAVSGDRRSIGRGGREHGPSRSAGSVQNRVPDRFAAFPDDRRRPRACSRSPAETRPKRHSSSAGNSASVFFRFSIMRRYQAAQRAKKLAPKAKPESPDCSNENIHRPP